MRLSISGDSGKQTNSFIINLELNVMLAANATNPLFTLTIQEAEPLFKKWLSDVLLSDPQLPVKSEPDKFLTRQDACEILRLSLPTLAKYSKLGIIKAKRIGNRILYSPEAVQNACQELQSAKYKRR